ncbi:MAG: amidohydrolase [Cyclobacteriaceae bacterium]
MNKNLTLTLILFSFALLVSNAQKKEVNPKVKPDKQKQFVEADIEMKSAGYRKVAKSIWGYAELGFQETRSSGLLQEVLKKEGFSVEAGVSGMPTAFVATFSSAVPEPGTQNISDNLVIGILAEFDALPGLSQDSAAAKFPITEGGGGHACGHHLFGTASVAAAAALKNWLVENKITGTVKLFGTPAEEGGSAKVYMVRDGLFNDVDVVLHWHPSDNNDASPETCLAIKQAVFRFYGRSAHAAAAPYAGRSALDGAEAMNHMVNLMREHVPQETRIHYVIKNGGLAANVVPDFVEVEYMVRHPDARVLDEIWNRIVKASEGAATGTETTVKHEVISGSYNLMRNETLARLMQSNLEKVGGVKYTKADIAFANELQKTLPGNPPAITNAQKVEPFKLDGFFYASTDVGDITWVVPSTGLGTATWVPGTPAHSWQAVACGGTNIGMTAMANAAKVIAMTGVDLFLNPAIAKQAKAELQNKTGPDFKYKSMIGDRKPPLDYRMRK